MKRIVLIVAVLIGVSCNKEQDTPQPEVVIVESVNPRCYCGSVGAKGVQGGGYAYYIDVTNNCSGVTKRFYVGMDEYLSDEYCTTENPW
tara:strand:- start:756 stop:1022 length:267 start_codon:yes stop_codon:yes gene_type:complete